MFSCFYGILFNVIRVRTRQNIVMYARMLAISYFSPVTDITLETIIEKSKLSQVHHFRNHGRKPAGWLKYPTMRPTYGDRPFTPVSHCQYGGLFREIGLLLCYTRWHLWLGSADDDVTIIDYFVKWLRHALVVRVIMVMSSVRVTISAKICISIGMLHVQHLHFTRGQFSRCCMHFCKCCSR